jgi:hypothetical protein
VDDAAHRADALALRGLVVLLAKLRERPRRELRIDGRRYGLRRGGRCRCCCGWRRGGLGVGGIRAGKRCGGEHADDTQGNTGHGGLHFLVLLSVVDLEERCYAEWLRGLASVAWAV